MYLIEGSGIGRRFLISKYQLGISAGGESGLAFCSRLEDEKWKTWKTLGPDRTSRSQISPLQTRYGRLLDLGRFLAFLDPGLAIWTRLSRMMEVLIVPSVKSVQSRKIACGVLRLHLRLRERGLRDFAVAGKRVSKG